MDTYHWDVVGCFIWDLFETSWRRTDETSSLPTLETWSRHTNKTSWRCTTETSWRRSTETSLGVSFETYLRRCWAVQRDVVTTSPRRLVAGWDVISIFSFSISIFSWSSTVIEYSSLNLLQIFCSPLISFLGFFVFVLCTVFMEVSIAANHLF